MTLARRPRPYPRPRPLPLDAVTAAAVTAAPDNDDPSTDYEIDDAPGPPGVESVEFLGRHWWHEAHAVGLALAREWAERAAKQ